MAQLPIVVTVREVWESNLQYELAMIEQSLDQFPFAAIDTEFPGTVFEVHSREPAALYASMKRNVDALNLIQLGLTISDENGKLPNFGTGLQYVWEFNFKDFDCDRDLQNADSISLLRRQGIDFVKNREIGIDSRDFALFFRESGLGKSFFGWNRIWITFHGIYDFGYLIKILHAEELPDDFNEFMNLVTVYFGDRIYDLKNIFGFFGLRGGLERVAESLNVGRATGQSHQAGSDSLLTMQSFWKLMKTEKDVSMMSVMEKCKQKLYGCSQLIASDLNFVCM